MKRQQSLDEIIAALTQDSSITQSQSSKAQANAPCAGLPLTPSELLLIAGLLKGVLNIQSILVDVEQNVQVIVGGKMNFCTKDNTPSPTDLMIKQMMQMPVGDIISSILKNV